MRESFVIAKAMTTSFAIILALAFFTSLSAVRVEADDIFAVNSAADACMSSLRSIYKGSTYRELFSPRMDGTYRIRNRQSGKYLTGTTEGYLGMSLHHIGSGASDWSLKRVRQKGTPVYTLQNKKSKRFLVAGEGQLFSFKEVSEAGHWNLNLATDGVHHSIISPEVYAAMTGNTSGSVSLMDSSTSGEEGQWFLDLRQSFFRIPKGDTAAYKSQWATAADIPMWAGTDFTWLQNCKDGQVDCETGYAQLREAAKLLGKVSETHRRLVLENNVQQCDTPLGMTAGLTSRNPKVLEELRKSAGQACEGRSLANISSLFKQAVVQECFAACVDDVFTDLETKQLACQKPDNVTALMMDVMRLPGCGGLPPNSVEGITEFTQLKRCQKWPKPSLLWMPDTDGPRSVATADGNPTCSLEGKSRNFKDIKKADNRACPSGSTCQCPRTYRRGRKTIDDLTFSGNLMIQNGEGSLAAFVVGRIESSAKKVARNMLLRGGSLASNVAALPSPIFYAQVGWGLGKYAYAAFKWTCGDTVACWPLWPAKTRTSDTRTACRAPEEAKSGGSGVWFMPPPGVMIKRRRWYKSLLRKCEYTQCDKADMMFQRVGFGAAKGDSGRPNVYNCQPLEFADMSAEQQKMYVEELEKSNSGEYTLPSLQ